MVAMRMTVMAMSRHGLCTGPSMEDMMKVDVRCQDQVPIDVVTDCMDELSFFFLCLSAHTQKNTLSSSISLGAHTHTKKDTKLIDSLVFFFVCERSHKNKDTMS